MAYKKAMRVKNIFSTFLVLSFLIATQSEAAPWGVIEKNKEIRLATEGLFAPFNFKKGAELTGFEVELGSEIAKN